MSYTCTWGEEEDSNGKVLSSMERKKRMEVLVSRSGGCSSSRWTPTKEQISVLEELYREGLRTPSAKQIQQMASRLGPCGRIKGKNVYYWFQNCKARMRQKQNQEAVFYISTGLTRNKPKRPSYLFHLVLLLIAQIVCAMRMVLQALFLCRQMLYVLCSAICIPQTVVGFYPHLPKAVVPNHGLSGMQNKTQRAAGGPHGCLHPIDACEYDDGHQDLDQDHEKHETMELFPLHPTGVLGEKLLEKSPSFSSAVSN